MNGPSLRRLLAAVAALGLTTVTGVAGAGLAGAGATGDGRLTVTATDVARFPEVQVAVAVPQELTGRTLDASAFSVREAGNAHTVTVSHLGIEGLEVVLALDTSASMRGQPLAAAKGAARVLLDQLPAEVPVAVVGFGASPAIVSSRSTDRAAQARSIEGLQVGGETALYDALVTSLGQLSGATGTRRVIVLLSDGGDTVSSGTLDATTAALATSNTALFAVELRTGESNPAALGQLVSAGNGRLVPADDASALAAAFEVIGRQLVLQYQLRWTSEAEGGPVDVEIVVDTGDVRASAMHVLELPGDVPTIAAGGPPLAETETTPARNEGGLGTWALVAGAGLCFAALFAYLVRVIALRPPRARGLGRDRGGLTGVAQRMGHLVDRVLAHRNLGVPIGDALERAAIDLRPSELVIIVSSAAGVAAAASWLMLGLLAVPVAVLLVVAAASMVVRQLAQRRRQHFADQLGDTVQLLAAGLRAGHALSRAIDTVAKETEAPTSQEFRRLIVEMRIGRDLTEALQAMAKRMRSSDFDWVVQSIDIHREVGGDLAEVLDNVGKTIRDRTRLRRQVQALTAEGKLSAMVLVFLPLAMAGVMAVTNPSYLSVLFTTGKGLVLVGIGATLLVIGGLWLRRLVRPLF